MKGLASAQNGKLFISLITLFTGLKRKGRNGLDVQIQTVILFTVM